MTIRLSNLRKWNLKTSEFIDEYKKYLNAGTIKEQNIDYVLDTLYNFSVIGNQHKSIKNVQYFKYMQTNMTYNKEENIVIHPCLGITKMEDLTFPMEELATTESI